MQVITSLTFKNALKIPGMHPHKAPAKTPPTKAISHTKNGGITEVGITRAKINVAAVLIKY